MGYWKQRDGGNENIFCCYYVTINVDGDYRQITVVIDNANYVLKSIKLLFHSWIVDTRNLTQSKRSKKLPIIYRLRNYDS